MKIRHLAAAALAGILMNPWALADEALTMADYHYSGDTGTDLSSMLGGPMSINAFMDGRSDKGVTLSESTPEALLQRTLTEAFDASNANLTTEEGAPLQLSGNLIEMSIEEGNEGLEVLIRCELKLNNQGRDAWQSTVFSRVQTSEHDAAKALEQGLDRFVNELFADNYFTMALGIF